MAFRILALVTAVSLMSVDAALLMASCKYTCRPYTLCLQADVECKFCKPIGGACDGVSIDFNPASIVIKEADVGGDQDIRVSEAICYEARACTTGFPIFYQICLGNGSDCVGPVPVGYCLLCVQSNGIPILEYVENVQCLPCGS